MTPERLAEIEKLRDELRRDDSEGPEQEALTELLVEIKRLRKRLSYAGCPMCITRQVHDCNVVKGQELAVYKRALGMASHNDSQMQEFLEQARKEK